MLETDNIIVRLCLEQTRALWMRAEQELREEYDNHMSLFHRTNGAGKTEHRIRSQRTLAAIDYCRAKYRQP